MKLTGITRIKGKITLKSGLHIGAGDMEMRIGGLDNPVIKHPHTLEPYIPGSSLKGKVRSLLEMKSGLMLKTLGKPVSLDTLKEKLSEKEKEECEKILKLFGSSGADSKEAESLGPTRVSFADCPLDEGWKEKAFANHLSFTEVKSENTIDRIRGTAEHPRFIERVPANAEFDFSVTFKSIGEETDTANEESLLDYLLLGLKLLSMDALGGSGSRGYGRIELTFDDPDIVQKFSAIKDPFQEG